MFELCDNGQFLTKKDLVIAKLTAPDLNPTRASNYFKDYDVIREGYADGDPINYRYFRINTRFVGFMLEAEHPWSRFNDYRHNGHLGYKITDNVHVLATYVFEQNHLLDHPLEHYDTYDRDMAKYFYVGWKGAKGIAHTYTMCDSDRKWWLNGTKIFRDHSQVRIDFIRT